MAESKTHNKGVVLANGAGTRLYPATCGMSKQMSPVYDKPVICHPLSALMPAGNLDILLISTPQDALRFEQFLGDDSNWGLN